MVPKRTAGDATLTEVIAGLEEQGYTGSFVVSHEGSVRCRSCGSVIGPTSLSVDGLRRIEGASDPSDMAAVLAVRCPHCDSRGCIVARYGPEAGPGDEAVLRAAEDPHEGGLDVAERASHSEPPPAAPS